MRTGDDEAASPKYAHIERERRFLVDSGRLPPLDRARAAVRIEDRYIDGTRLRLRRMTDVTSGAHRRPSRFEYRCNLGATDCSSAQTKARALPS